MKLRRNSVHGRRGSARLAAAAATVAAALVLSGCGAGGGGSSAAGDDGLTDRGRGRRQARAAADRRPLRRGDRHDGDARRAAVRRPVRPHLHRARLPATPSFDVAALDAIWLTRLRAGVAPLDDLFTDEVKADLFPVSSAEAQVDGHVRRHAGLDQLRDPLLPHRPVRGPDEQAAFEAKYGYELVPPTTWEQYRDVAEFFTRDTDGDGAVDCTAPM